LKPNSTGNRVRLVVSGWVQGVFYRHETQMTASRLGLTGWVRNRMDGSVEIVAEGPKEKLEELIGWSWQGPPSARVQNVDVFWESASGEFQSFQVER